MEQVKKIRAKKMMLWFSMISISMTFAGLTSAYVVSKSRPDWLEDFSLPASLYWSTLVILLSSLTFWLAKKELTKQSKTTVQVEDQEKGPVRRKQALRLRSKGNPTTSLLFLK